jgi:DNA segregation ATPase FtsK/SpoIIIE-like protein
MDADPVNHRKEVTGVVFLAFAVILGVSYYLPDSATGIMGVFLRALGKGMFGVTAYAIPVIFIYAAVDFFLEKRIHVAPKRVISVLLVLLSVSALLPVITVDKSTIASMSLDATKNSPLASNAIVLLWKSGVDPSIIPSTTTGTPILSGGIIGGTIALGLTYLAAKIGAIIILAAFTVSQIGLIFNISLAQTAAKTASALKTTSIRATGALRSGAESFRTFSQNISSRNRYDDSMDTQPGSQTVPVSSGSFSVTDIRDASHPGFIDLEGTDTPMNASSFRGNDPYDMDLSKPVMPTTVTGDDPFETIDTMVETDFLRAAKEPIPTSQAVAISELPAFMKDKEEPSWINIHMNTVDGTQRTDENLVIRKIGSSRNPQQEQDRNQPTDDEYVSSFGNESASVNEKASEPVQTVTLPSPSETKKVSTRQIPMTIPKQPFKAAPTALLRPDNQDDAGKSSKNTLTAQGKKLEDTLASFGVAAKVINVTHGPAITRFELAPGPGIKVSRIVNLTDDLALAMAAMGVRIEAPIPGKSAIGIEIPNAETTPVTLRGLLDSSSFKKNPSPLVAALGRDIPGNPIFCDLAKMPHLLIAGATGSGKSVCINSILISILCKATPDQVKMIMIDPKVVELSIYNGIPHLLAPVVTDPKKAANTLNWAVGEMTRRYGLFAEASVRDFRGYNEDLAYRKEPEIPLILIVIDELADLMQVASKEVEESIARLTAMARAAGIHLLIATQRPSVDVITGVIKANIPSRIAFAVSSQVDSRTILDMVGAEKLLGKGDMLYYPQSAAKPQRGQGAFVSDAEVESIIEYLKAQNLGSYDPDEAEAITSASSGGMKSAERDAGDEDELLPQAVDIVLQAGCASVSILQRRMNIGYPRAARLIDRMQEKGYIGAFEGSKPRKLLITQSQWLEIQSKGG